MLLKKILTLLFVVITLFLVRVSALNDDFWNWEENFYYNYSSDTNMNEDKTDIAWIIKHENIDNDSSILYKIREMFWLVWDTYDSDEPAVNYIKKIINIVLSLVWFISLLLTIYAFYLMLFSKQDDWLSKAKKILKWVWLAILILWISYFITSFIFYLYNVWVWNVDYVEQWNSNINTNVSDINTQLSK